MLVIISNIELVGGKLAVNVIHVLTAIFVAATTPARFDQRVFACNTTPPSIL